MNAGLGTALRFAAFSLVLAGLFGAAYAVGASVDEVRDEHKSNVDGDGAMAGGHAGHGAEGADDDAPRAVRGLAATQDGLTLQLLSDQAPLGRETELAFRIVDESGRTEREFDVEHTKRMHVIVVRRDLTGFQHLHPQLGADGVWHTPLTLREPGSYRVFADFVSNDQDYTLAADIDAGRLAQPVTLPTPRDSVTVDGYDVRLDTHELKAGHEAELEFDIERNGRPVQTGELLGARGHLVALRAGDLAFLHVHPDADELDFMAEFPSPGKYRLFLQVLVGGAVRTAEFTVVVGR